MFENALSWKQAQKEMFVAVPFMYKNSRETNAILPSPPLPGRLDPSGQKDQQQAGKKICGRAWSVTLQSVMDVGSSVCTNRKTWTKHTQATWKKTYTEIDLRTTNATMSLDKVHRRAHTHTHKLHALCTVSTYRYLCMHIQYMYVCMFFTNGFFEGDPNSGKACHNSFNKRLGSLGVLQNY